MKTSFRYPLPLLLVFAAGMMLPGGISAAADLPPLPPLPPPSSATSPRKLSVPRRTNAPPTAPQTGQAQPTGRNAPAEPPQPAFELQDGDRVVLLGDTLIEREQRYGYVEARLTVRWPDRNITFRNLGWSADTVMGQSRVSFDWSKPEEEWFQQLTNQIAAVKPTVAILGYGMASSFAGEAGLPKFKADLNKLMDAIQSLGQDTKVRFMFLGPIRHEELGPPFPNPTEHNKQLERYSMAIKETARERGFPFIDLFHNLGDGTKDRISRAYTDNGIHLNAYGYSRVGDVIERTMRWPANSWRVGILADGKIRQGSAGTEVTDLERTDDHVRLSMQDQRLVFPVSADGGKDQFPSTSPRNLLQFQGLKPGNYALMADGKELMIQTEKGWGSGRAILRGPQQYRADLLRETIIRKNELFFHRWRPENRTYLLGFRKYEQGQNAREIPQFDPLVQAEEEKIAKLRKPAKHIFEIVRTDKAADVKPRFDAELKYDSETDKEFASTVKEKTFPFTPQPLPQFEIAPELEINLFAENPQLAKPIQMNFDPKGRLWVASSSVYPQIEPGQKADDKILILEDTDGDGKADKSTVFVDGLLIPTGVEPGDGGCYVGQSTEVLHFKDKNGDDKADEKRILLSGFGTEDTHHIVHTLRWGPDGQLNMNQSIYIHTHTETPYGVVRLNSGGVLQLRPPTGELGIFLRGFCNPWGHDFDEYGQSFVTDGAGSEGVCWGLSGAMYFTYAGARRELQSISPGNYPKFCGLEMIYSKHFPDDWQGSVVTCDFRANRIVRFSITEQGSGYVAKEMPDLLRTTNVTFRPIDVKLGPDGALYIADWSNPIINHGEVDFRDARRDRVHGRIWRVTAKGRPLLEKPSLINAANTALLDQLLSPNAYNRSQSRRVLTERGTNIVADLKQWTLSQNTEKALLEALWMHQSINLVEPELLKKLLAATDGRIRAAATRVLSAWQNRINSPVELLAERIADEQPRVRVEAMRAVSKIPNVRSADLILGALDRPMDPFIDYAVWLSMNDVAKPWVEALQSGAWKSEGRENQLTFGLKAIEPSLAGSVLAKFLRDKPLPRDGGPWIELIGHAGGPAELRQLFDQLVKNGFDEAASLRAITALSEAARLRSAKPEGDLTAISGLFAVTNEKIQTAAIRLAGTWKLTTFTEQFLKLGADARVSAQSHQAAFASLREFGGPEVVAGLRSISAKSNSSEIRRQAVVTLAALDLEKAIPDAVDVIMSTADENDALNLWRSLLDIKGAGDALVRALPKTAIPQIPAKAGMRAAREGGRKEQALVLGLAQGAGLPQPEQEFSQWEFLGLAQRTLADGDPVRGERIYRRLELGCITCHSIGGAGGKVGPDLTSIGASAPLDYVIESIFVPNSKIKEGFHSLLIQTKNEQEFSGILVREDGTELVLRNAVNQEVSIPKSEIKARTNGGSLMPSGLVDNLTTRDRLDLFRFLSELGKPGPYDASRGNVARVWKIYSGASDRKQADEGRLKKGDLKLTGWSPVYAMVDGRLPKQDLEAQASLAGNDHAKTVFAATQFQVPNSGLVRLKLDAPAGSEVWIDGSSVKTSGEISADLKSGTRTIVVKLDPKELSDYLRLESQDGTFLAN